MAQSETINERVVRQAQRLRSELRKLPLVKQAEELGERAVRGVAQQVANRLDQLPIATKHRVERAERRLTEIEQELDALRATEIDPAEVRAALADFAAVWDSLSPKEQARILQLLVERVEYDGEASTVSVTIRPTGIRTLAEATRSEVAA